MWMSDGSGRAQRRITNYQAVETLPSVQGDNDRDVFNIRYRLGFIGRASVKYLAFSS